MSLSIVMYHYVRDPRTNRHPRLKSLATGEFREQIAYIKRHYQVISGDDLVAAVAAGRTAELPPAALLLTFDDGYRDHITEVLPVLQREGLPACFFPPSRCVQEGEVLDVNKIHFVLASVTDQQAVIDFIFRELDRHRASHGLADNAHYWRTLAVASRLDPAETIFIKRILQRELPEAVRRDIVDALFREYVTTDEKGFAGELYMSLDELRALRAAGMHVGSHGHGHYWMDSLDEAGQDEEIDRSLAFLREVGTPADGWIMCYPYGAYNDTLLSVLRRHGGRVGVTTRVDIADPASDDPLVLPRLDTNDLPKRGDAAPNDWTVRATTTGTHGTP